jgi:xanthosine utilization system XapX-like protein
LPPDIVVELIGAMLGEEVDGISSIVSSSSSSSVTVALSATSTVPAVVGETVGRFVKYEAVEPD